MPTPEAQARQNIDNALQQCGWAIQRYKDYDSSAGRGIALIEVPVKAGTADYLLLVDKQPVGVIEAKRQGTPLSGVADQSGHYGDQLPDFLAIKGPLPFLYESTGVETFFRNRRDPEPRSRRIFTFHRPETLAEWIAEPDTLRRRLAQMPFAHPLAKHGMRDCQIEAISELEKSFAADRPRALIQMATGAGETIRRELLKRADVHTLLRLPTGIFYAQGVKANVLFFDRKPAADKKAWTERLWIYDLRTNKHFTLKENTLKRADLDDFVKSYNPKNRHNRKESDRFKPFTYDDLIKRDKANLDFFWLKDESLEDSANLPDPDVLTREIVDDLEAALEQFAAIAEDLKK